MTTIKAKFEGRLTLSFDDGVAVTVPVVSEHWVSGGFPLGDAEYIGMAIHHSAKQAAHRAIRKLQAIDLYEKKGETE